MTPTQTIIDRVSALLATDTTTLDQATDALKVTLIMANFTPGPDTDIGSLTVATFTGSGAKLAGTGAAQNFRDPSTGQQVVQLKEPAGGWHWQATDAVNLPQTIYGFVVTSNDLSETFGSYKFPVPIQLLSAGDGVDIPQVRFNVVNPPLV